MPENTNNAKYVVTGKPRTTGAVFMAPLGTALPTDASSELSEEFLPMGHISNDGLKNNNTAETENIEDWGGETVEVAQTSKEDTYGLKFIEVLNPNVQKLIYGEDNVTLTESQMAVKATADEAVGHVFVIDQITKANKIHRTVIPSAKISEVGEITYVRSEAVGYEVTLTASYVNGVSHYDYYQL